MRVIRLLPLFLVLSAPLRAPRGSDPDLLLRDADLSRLAYPSFRSLLRVSPEDPKQPPSVLEVWRQGPTRSLIRFDGDAEAGRCLVRREDGIWLVTPGTRKPMKLNTGARTRGAVSLDAVLSARYSTDYRVSGRARLDGDRVRYDLVARDRSGGRVTYVVHEPTRRVTAIEMLLPGGKPWLVVEILEWQPGEPPLLKRIRTCEPLRGGACASVVFEETEPVDLTEAVFDPHAAAARRCRP